SRFRATNESRMNRSKAPNNWLISDIPQAVCQMGADRLLTRRRIAKEHVIEAFRGDERAHPVSPHLHGEGWEGPVELWDIATGRLVARLDEPGRSVERFQFVNQGRWITTLDEGGSTLLVFSAEDGRVLARLNHPAGDVVHLVDVSPTGKRLATTFGKRRADSTALLPWPTSPFSLRVWDTQQWRAEPITTPLVDAVPDG